MGLVEPALVLGTYAQSSNGVGASCFNQQSGPHWGPDSSSELETRLDSVVAVAIAQKSVVSIVSNGFGLYLGSENTLTILGLSAFYDLSWM